MEGRVARDESLNLRLHHASFLRLSVELEIQLTVFLHQLYLLIQARKSKTTHCFPPIKESTSPSKFFGLKIAKRNSLAEDKESRSHYSRIFIPCIF